MGKIITTYDQTRKTIQHHPEPEGVGFGVGG
jgi:hypothetical protein